MQVIWGCEKWPRHFFVRCTMKVDLLCFGFTIPLKAHLLGVLTETRVSRDIKAGNASLHGHPSVRFWAQEVWRPVLTLRMQKQEVVELGQCIGMSNSVDFLQNQEKKRGEKHMASWALSCVSFRGLLIVIQSQTNTHAPLWPQCKQANASAQISASLQTRLSCFWPRQKFSVTLHVRTRTRTLKPAQIMWV